MKQRNNMLWRIHPLLGNDREMYNCTIIYASTPYAIFLKLQFHLEMGPIRILNVI
jgi:hypothetical protein